YLHSSFFLLLAGYTLLYDAHVRIDIFYHRFGARRRALVDLVGCVFFLLPSVGLIGWQAFPYVRRSWATLEGSSTLGGLPLVFLLKSLILVFCFLVGVQGLSLAVASARKLLRPNAKLPAGS
ncbi:MAG: TRAP transporter small permease subunit, partial [Geminicoccales bacterium]